jgi:hypothetical protein
MALSPAVDLALCPEESRVPGGFPQDMLPRKIIFHVRTVRKRKYLNINGSGSEIVSMIGL